MSYAQDFGSLANETLTVHTLSTRNAYGEPKYSTSTLSLKGRLSETSELVIDENGKEVKATSMFWVLSTSTSQSSITAESRVRFSGDGSTVRRRVISVERPQDEDGLHHTKLFLG